MAMHKVVWQEGMLLRPQHFQQNDRYYDYQLKTRTQKLESYAWGFFELEIDRQFLNMGKLVVSKAIVNGGQPLKRMHAAAQGRGTAILKRTSHVEIHVASRKEKS